MARETRIRPWDSCEAWVIGFVERRSENDPTVYPTPLFLPSASRLLAFPFIGLALFIFAITLFLSSLQKKKISRSLSFIGWRLSEFSHVQICYFLSLSFRKMLARLKQHCRIALYAYRSFCILNKVRHHIAIRVLSLLRCIVTK